MNNVEPIWKEWTDRSTGSKYYFKGADVSWVKPERYIPEEQLRPFVETCDKLTADLERLQREAHDLSESHAQGRRQVTVRDMNGLSAEITTLLEQLDSAPIPKFKPNPNDSLETGDPDSRARRKRLIKYAEDLDKKIVTLKKSLS